MISTVEKVKSEEKNLPFFRNCRVFYRRFKFVLKPKFLPLFLLMVCCLSIGVDAQGELRVPQNFSLQVNGQVRFAATRAPAENVLVRIESSNGGLVSQTTTDRSGRFTFSGLSKMQYIVTAHLPGYKEVSENINLATANSDYLNIELASDKTSVSGVRDSDYDLSSLAVLDAKVPFEARTEFEQGQILLEDKNKINEAIQHLEKALVIYPQYLEAQFLLGLAEMDLQNWEKAEKSLQTAIAINKDAATAYFALGNVYYHEKKLAEAQKILLQAIKLNDQYPAGHFLLAKVFWDLAPALQNEQQRNIALESAWQETNRALQLQPDLAEAHLLAGNLLLRAKRAKDALSHFEQYLKLKPKGEFAGQTRDIVEKIKKALK